MIAAASLSGSGSTLIVAGSPNDDVRLWVELYDVASVRKLGEFILSEGVPRAFAVSDDASTVLVIGYHSETQIWKRVRHSLRLHRVVPLKEVETFALSGTGHIGVAIDDSGTARLIDPDSGEHAQIDGGEGTYTSAALTRSGQIMLLGTRQGSLELWRSLTVSHATGRCQLMTTVAVPWHVIRVAVTEDGRTMAAGGSEGQVQAFVYSSRTQTEGTRQ